MIRRPTRSTLTYTSGPYAALVRPVGEFRRQHRPEGHDDAAALEIGGGQPAMAERDALAGGGGLDDHRGIAEAGAALDVDAADAGGLQPVAPVRAPVLARTLVVQQGVMARVLRRAPGVRALPQA